jgi:hypothetical protein
VEVFFVVRLILTVFLVLALSLPIIGCGNTSTPAVSPTQSDPAPHQPEQQKVDVNALYGQIATGMSYDEVMQIMTGYKPFMANEGEIDTPAGKITTQTVSWQIDKHLLIVIFENKEVLSKDLTKMP